MKCALSPFVCVCVCVFYIDISHQLTCLKTPILMSELPHSKGDDFSADIGATRTRSAQELLYARQSVVVHAKAYGLQAIDIVNIRLKELEHLEEECKEGAIMGFTGKQIIHPDQIDPVQSTFVRKALHPTPNILHCC